MTKFFAQVFLATAVLAAVSGPALACETIVSSESYGDFNSSSIDAAACAQVGHYQDGDHNEIYTRAVGDVRVAVGQLEDYSRAKVNAEGSQIDVGVFMRNGADVGIDIRGDDSDAAVYANGGRVRYSSNGTRNRGIFRVN